MLARQRPEEWKHFLQAMQAYADYARDNCVSSPVDMLQVNQGRAQAAGTLFKLLSECISTADRIERNAK